MARKYFVGQELLSDIRETITTVNARPLSEAPGKADTSDDRALSPPAYIRVGAATDAWGKGESKQVAFTLAGSPRTVTATNLFADVGQDGTYSCAVARVGASWYLVAAECPDPGENPQTASSASVALFFG